MELDDAVRCALDGDALLFVGAGLSFLSTCKGERKVPDGRALVDLLLEQPAGTGSKHTLDRVAGAVKRKKGVEYIYNIICDNFLVESVDPRLELLYSIPWKRIYTTNYDNAIEVALKNRRRPSSVTLSDKQADLQLGSIVHLNGYAKRISPQNIEKELLLTDASYATSRLLSSGWLSTLEQDIRTSRSVFFVGYSLYDLDIDRILYASDQIGRKTFFSIAPKADEIETSTIERYGSIVPGGIENLYMVFLKIRGEYNAPSFPGGLTALRELSATGEPNPAPMTSAQILQQQLVYGRLPEHEVLNGAFLFGDQPYLVMRQQDKLAQQAILQGPWRDILFTGEIASGKSASTLNLASFLIGEGYRVFYAIKSTLLSNDLLRLGSINEKIAVIFDGYSNYRDEIRLYAECRHLLHRIILTERSAIHELIGDYIDTTPHLGPTREVVLDKIDLSDIPSFEALTNFGGFWGQRAGSAPETRCKYIRSQLNGSLYRLLVEIINSEKVQQELRELLKPLSYDVNAAKIFCSALIINTIGYDFTIGEWQYLFDRQQVTRMITSYAEQVKHFLIKDSDLIYIRNGILSSHILHAFLDSNLISECLISIYELSVKYGGGPKMWNDIRIELTKFSTIEPMFSASNISNIIFKYYDSIRVYGDTANNPDYWLQLGIASTVFDDLPRGKLCFENAYSREKSRRRPNLIRIDNYYSRFQMRLAIKEPDADAAFKLFIGASERLDKQIFLDINRHYPFKTGRYFSDIAAKHYEKWHPTQRNTFENSAAKLREKAIEWRNNNRENSIDVEILIRELDSLLDKIRSIL